MIRLQDLTPEVYYRQSRDFQFIGRLYDLVLNSIKTNTELIYSLPLSQNSDTRFLDLMAMTLGLKASHSYNLKQLTAICSIFMTIMKVKGTEKAIELIINALLNAEGIVLKTPVDIYVKDNEIQILLTEELIDITLLVDLLDYVIPAGMSYTLIRNIPIELKNKNSPTELGLSIDIQRGTGNQTMSRLIDSSLTEYVKPVIPMSDKAPEDENIEVKRGRFADVLMFKPEGTTVNVIQSTNTEETPEESEDNE